MSEISNDLIEAYKGYYEDELEQVVPWTDAAVNSWVIDKIRSHTPKERLEVYLEWNGILGYSSRIWEITQGEL